ncbi:unnamed protein product [Symbiodinium pilosum]|uniref:Uncharacterized protein n=1 Tax=Symbiodinium pilosum TaxID=2952 RepID=A0A812S674_SYMPI|nr:unnamed protein product [Symbiodinium pilosum]
MAVNPRYQKWLEDKRTIALKDLNEVDRCFGWAKYVHKGDGAQKADDGAKDEAKPEQGRSVEWRPAILRKTATTDSFAIEWVHGTPGNSEGKLELPKAAVLLAPRAPKIDDNTDRRHLEVLKQARRLRASGKSDWEIEAYLNKLLEKQWEEREEQRRREESSMEAEPKPPKLTIDQIRAYMQREEGQAVGKAY